MAVIDHLTAAALLLLPVAQSWNYGDCTRRLSTSTLEAAGIAISVATIANHTLRLHLFTFSFISLTPVLAYLTTERKIFDSLKSKAKGRLYQQTAIPFLFSCHDLPALAPADRAGITLPLDLAWSTKVDFPHRNTSSPYRSVQLVEGAGQHLSIVIFAPRSRSVASRRIARHRTQGYSDQHRHRNHHVKSASQEVRLGTPALLHQRCKRVSRTPSNNLGASPDHSKSSTTSYLDMHLSLDLL